MVAAITRTSVFITLEDPTLIYSPASSTLNKRACVPNGISPISSMKRVPALRERKEDIILLFRKFSVDFAEKYKASPIQLDEDAKNVLINYPWPGNVRELKNIAEQISVLSQDKMITGNDIRRFLPQHSTNRLPMLVNGHTPGHADFMNERDILYKLFFDMKKDVTELKKMFFDILQNPSSSIAASARVNESYMHDLGLMREGESSAAKPLIPAQTQPMIISENAIHDHTEVDESLNIMDKEKELIIKALKKHRGKRKDAASDLGISERTLYRKLKEYYIEE